MRRGHAIWIVGLLAAALGAAAAGAHASAAGPARTHAGAALLDKTWSCRVQPAHVVNLYTSATLPPANNKPQPGGLQLNTGVKTTVHNGTTVSVAQVSLQAKQNSLRIDTESCRKVKRQIPLKPKGLPTPPTTVTATLRGYDNEQCHTSGRVLVRLQLRSDEPRSGARTDGGPERQREEPADRVLQLEPEQGQCVSRQDLRHAQLS